VEQVAERLGLHVRTVRNYVRDGRLKAVRIGKQYRIAREDLEAFTGGAVPALPAETVRRTRHIEVSSIVQIDAIDRTQADRVANTLMAAAAGGRDGLRIETIYDEERGRMKIVILSDVATGADVLRLIDTVTGSDR
jgi:excisionase family DNA binding protein